MRILSVLALFGAMGCVGQKGLEQEETGLENDTSTTGTTPVYDTGDGCDEVTEHDPGEIFPEGAPSVTMTLAGYQFEGSTGYWVATDCTTLISSTYFQGDVAYVVSMELYGDANSAGTFPIKFFSYSENPAQAEATVSFVAENPGAAIEITGHSERNHLFGSLKSSFSAVDSVSGGAGDITALEIESWPVF